MRYGVVECNHCHKTEKLKTGSDLKWMASEGWLQQYFSLGSRDFCSEECAMAFKQQKPAASGSNTV